MVGGFGQTKQCTKDQKEILEKVVTQIKKELQINSDNFDCVTYKSQVVAGVNYIFKVQVDGSKFLEVKVYVPLPYTQKPPQLTYAKWEKQ